MLSWQSVDQILLRLHRAEPKYYRCSLARSHQTHWELGEVLEQGVRTSRSWGRKSSSALVRSALEPREKVAKTRTGSQLGVHDHVDGEEHKQHGPVPSRLRKQS